MIPFWKKTDKGGKKKPPKPAVPRTAQQSIPMQRMFEDGTCRVKPNYYTRTIQYQDINYQLAQQEDKTAIFEEWCSFLNFFDSSIKFELSFVNMATDSTEFEKSIRIPYQRDGFDDVRAEYSQMLRQQLAKGNNGLTKTKFITFGVEGESMAQVKPRLDHIQNDLLNNFHRLGVQAKPLNGVQRLKLMHDMFNMDGASKFHFDWKDLVKSGLSVKDAIAPTAFAFKNSRTFQMGGIYCAASFLSITASDISDQLLKDFLDMDSSQIVTMHIQSVDQNRAIKTVKRTITELDRSKIEEQKKAIRAGYDIDIIPSDLATYGRDAKALLKELQSQNERMFLVTFLVLNTGRTEQELENNVFQASSIAQKHNCNLCRLDYQQEQGLMSSLPLADCQIEIQRGLTTSSTAIFIPFTTQELYQSGKESLYYGLNALSNNLIMVDRKKLKNPNGLILGTPGSGKSFSAKREITNAFLVTDDDIIICDPEAEYAPLVERLHGQVIHIGPASTQYINPMDINSNYSEEDNPLALKADFILSLCELVVGGKEGLQPVEKTVIDRCVHVVYRKYFENPTPENMPLLEDLYNALLTQDEPEARHVAAALEIYVKGSLNIFNHHTNVDIHNRIVCFDIKQLGKQLKKLGMLIVQDAVWGRVTANRSAGKSTRYYADEFHLLLKEEQTAAYSVEIWKRFRKWGGIPTALTQNVKDLLASPEVSNIFENSDFVYMREMLYALDLPQYLNRNRLGYLLILGFETNNEIHTDYPPHWHLIYRWPNHAGSPAPHIYLAPDGKMTENACYVDCAHGTHRDYSAGEWCPFVDPYGHDVCAIRINADGGMSITKPMSSIYTMSAYTPDVGVTIYKDDTLIGTIRTENDTDQGIFNVTWNSTGNLNFHGSYSETIEYNTLTGAILKIKR